jgi:hypothetical protein
MQSKEDSNLASLVLPSGVLDFFNLSKIVKTVESFEIHLEEKNLIPEEYKGQRLSSKGFYDEITIQDFPIRGKAVFLHIKRRRWTNESTGDIVFRTWELVAKGTRMTKEFAAFLKAISRYETGKL